MGTLGKVTVLPETWPWKTFGWPKEPSYWFAPSLVAAPFNVHSPLAVWHASWEAGAGSSTRSSGSPHGEASTRLVRGTLSAAVMLNVGTAAPFAVAVPPVQTNATSPACSVMLSSRIVGVTEVLGVHVAGPAAPAPAGNATKIATAQVAAPDRRMKRRIRLTSLRP